MEEILEVEGEEDSHQRNLMTSNQYPPPKESNSWERNPKRSREIEAKPRTS